MLNAHREETESHLRKVPPNQNRSLEQLIANARRQHQRATAMIVDVQHVPGHPPASSGAQRPVQHQSVVIQVKPTAPAKVHAKVEKLTRSLHARQTNVRVATLEVAEEREG